ncbi:hypothetical protein P389DRAFT_200316 [Cystobasidium minutum MCA 4210]|uniref:uncharacterized protein n=1 Tax=Cystobasidium minutum MCA 4210 TaxID=1397322 RepID=UPI0034CF1866|eukprot:jgi/Rhomi1/200316/MIX1145_33_32
MQSQFASVVSNLSKSQLQCGSCGKSEEILPNGQHFQRCAGCHMQRYCSRECQVAHWEQHKPICKQNQKVQETMKSEPVPSNNEATVSPSDINTAMSGFITKNRALLNHLATVTSDIFPLRRGINTPKQFPIVSMSITRFPGQGQGNNCKVTIDSVQVAPVEEMLQLQPSLRVMFEDLEKQSRNTKGCAGYTTVMLMSGPVGRPLPVLLNDDMRGTDLSSFGRPMSMQEWTDTLNKVA